MTLPGTPKDQDRAYIYPSDEADQKPYYPDVDHDYMHWPVKREDKEAPMYRSFTEIPSLRGRGRTTTKRGRSLSPAPSGIPSTMFAQKVTDSHPRPPARAYVPELAPGNVVKNVAQWVGDVEFHCR